MSKRVIDVLSKGDTVFYNSFGSPRTGMVTHVDGRDLVFDVKIGEDVYWGRATQVTAIHARTGERYSCYQGVAIPD